MTVNVTICCHILINSTISLSITQCIDSQGPPTDISAINLAIIDNIATISTIHHQYGVLYIGDFPNKLILI
jgi:hypothetical protein